MNLGFNTLHDRDISITLNFKVSYYKEIKTKARTF
ncbi:hypothetical protein HNQ06_000992 [Borrelia lanei]|uniref:Uncharacterized protein n=1 Tax=Borreliella lanei TaxID=373540 RepID=A0A7W9ZBJ5_9SPIR|nr:hypothetical protein [Borreliella lanei]